MGEHLTLEQAVTRRRALKQAGQSLVMTNGHFDLLHIGHLDYLEKARALGAALYVGINGDGITARLKGPGRPITPAVERARLLAALAPVDVVVIFEEVTAVTLVEQLRPEIYVKGGDYGISDINGLVQLSKPLPEKDPVEAYGGRVVLIEYLPEHSTTHLIKRIKALQ